jgi:CBS domain-containing protein
MKVKDVMTSEPRTCTPATSAAAAAGLMLEGDCGVLPVVDDGRLVGIVTDRDLFVALATRNRLASQLPVGEVARHTVLTCEPEDDVHSALTTMKEARVRRLPVVGFGGTVLGIVSMNDILRAAGAARRVRNDEVIEALQAICAHRHAAGHLVTA